MKSNNKNVHGWFWDYGDNLKVFGKLYGFNGGTLYFPDVYQEGTGFGAYRIFNKVKKSQINNLIKFIQQNHNNKTLKFKEPEGILYNMDSTGTIITDFVWTNYITKSKRTGYKYILYLKESVLRNLLN